MIRDTYERMQPQERGLFGDNEQAVTKMSGRNRLHDITLTLRAERPLAIGVSDPKATHLIGTDYIWLPRKLIEIEKTGATQVVVTMPEWLAKQKGLL